MFGARNALPYVPRTANAARRANEARDLAGRARTERVVVVRAAGRVELDPLDEVAARERDDRQLTEGFQGVVGTQGRRRRVAGRVAGRGQRVRLLATTLEPVVATEGERDVAVVGQVDELAARRGQCAVLLV